MPFNKSLGVEIEHKGSQKFPDNTSTGFIERDDLMSSVALWYQLEPHKPWPALRPGPARLPFREEPLVKGWQVVESARHSNHPIWVQQNKRLAMDGQYLLFAPPDDGGRVEIHFRIEQALHTELWGKMIHSTDGGRYRVLLDGKEIGSVDLRSDVPAAMTHRWASCQVAAGEHELHFEGAPRAPNTRACNLGFDALVVRKYAYSRPPDFDLRKIQVQK